jgi:hypothetical protein
MWRSLKACWCVPLWKPKTFAAPPSASGPFELTHDGRIFTLVIPRLEKTISGRSLRVYCGFKNDFTDAELAKVLGCPKEPFDAEGLLFYAFFSDEDKCIWLQSREEALDLKKMIQCVTQKKAHPSA